MIVESHGIRKAFGRMVAVRDVNLRVPAGSVFALIGTNGAGKTTLLRTMMNILQADQGSLTVLGTDSRQLNHHHFHDIGYVSENQKIPERLSIDQYFAYLRALYPRWDRAFENSLRTQFDLPPDRKLRHLSHGMRMKAMLVACLAFRPKLLVMDEPLSGLDPLVRDEVVEGILQQALDTTTIIISSHELTEIESFISHVAFMRQGQFLVQESIENLQDRFREINVTLSARKELPSEIPADWLAPEIAGHQLRFITSAFSNEQSLYQSLVPHFGPVKFSVESMSLRSVSKVLMRKPGESQVGSSEEPV